MPSGHPAGASARTPHPFSAFYEQHWSDLARYAASLTRDPDLGADLA